MKREDLLAYRDSATGTVRYVTDADLAALGYVRLTVDVEDVRKLMERSIERGCGCDALARQVLAALDGEET